MDKLDAERKYHINEPEEGEDDQNIASPPPEPPPRTQHVVGHGRAGKRTNTHINLVLNWPDDDDDDGEVNVRIPIGSTVSAKGLVSRLKQFDESSNKTTLEGLNSHQVQTNKNPVPSKRKVIVRHSCSFDSKAGTARATVLSLPSSPAFLLTPSYVRMRITVKHHVAGNSGSKMAIITDLWVLDSVVIIIGAFVFVYVYFTAYVFTFWRRRRLPQFRPTFPFGNIKDVILQKTSMSQMFAEIYSQFKHQKVCGIYLMHRPALLVCDPDMINDVLVKDFTHFHD
uniref:Uncharacterized protein n=1 Tax=Timema monikensis TaxID=170555 RepID=A0A7R9E846_9NEOP|nr:unnamed protein product [Timema monikensis]